jgi:PKD repeat protein
MTLNVATGRGLYVLRNNALVRIDAGAFVPNVAPTASFTQTVSNLTVNVTSTSTDSDGTIAGYTWQWGDGQTSTGATASHTYAAPGNYTIALTVTDDDGATGSTTQSVTTTAVPPKAFNDAAYSSLYAQYNGGNAVTTPDATDPALSRITSLPPTLGGGATLAQATATLQPLKIGTGNTTYMKFDGDRLTSGSTNVFRDVGLMVLGTRFRGLLADNSGVRTIVAAQGSGSARFYINILDGVLRTGARRLDGDTSVVILDPTGVNRLDGQWHTGVAVVNTANATISFFIDGVKVHTGPFLVSGATSNTNGSINIGASSTGAEQFKGDIQHATFHHATLANAPTAFPDATAIELHKSLIATTPA